GFFRILRRAEFLVLLILLVLPFKLSFAQQADSTDQLLKYLKIAAAQNPELKAEFYQYRAALEQAPQVSTLPDPEVMFMFLTNPATYSNPLSRMTLSASQQFPWFGTLEAAENRVQELAKAQLASFLSSRN